MSAEENATLSVNGVILGIRITSLNYTDGLWELIGGGLEQDFVIFSFKGTQVGRPFDFNIEIFGNNAGTLKLSLVLVVLLSMLFCIFK